jgi:lipopolysaccharide/colanic/teichoic acid biosynthesis glycosyltransferase
MMYLLAVGILFILSLPLQIIIALVIVWTSGFPVFFLQKRMGKNGKPYVMYKFRSMRVGAEHKQGALAHKNEADGPVFKIHRDPRFTKVGRFLAHTGLDELPQLFNVLKGDMALFGPRPLPMEEALKLTPIQKRRHGVRPGIISPAILTGSYHENFEEWMRRDIAYAKQKSMSYDLQLAFKSIGFLLSLLVGEMRKRV